MRLGRKKQAADAVEATAPGDDESTGTSAHGDTDSGPFDVDDLAADELPGIDLGAILMNPPAGRELKLQIDERSGAVRSVLLTDKAGAVELRAFAAPRNGDLWGEIRPQIAADTARRGGTATEREGRFGTELVCDLMVRTADGTPGRQVSRVVGVNGPRWLLRATFLGEPALSPEESAAWEDLIAALVVRRGANPMPVGEQLPLNVPEGMRRVDPSEDTPG